MRGAIGGQLSWLGGGGERDDRGIVKRNNLADGRVQ